MKTQSLFGIVVACSLGACGGTVPLNGGGSDGRGAQEAIDGGGVVEASITIGPTEAGVVQAGDAQPVESTPTCGGATGLGLVINPTVPRFGADGTTPYPYRPANEAPDGIDTQDCEDNISLQFELTICGLPTTDTFQVWAGPTDCTQQSARVSGTSGPFCWRVAPNLAQAQTSAATVHVRDITQFVDDTSSDVLAYNPSPSVTPGVGACDPFHRLATCGVGLTLFFMAIEGDDITIDATASYPLTAFPDPTDIASCGACGLALYSSGYPSSCQTALDGTCCAEEQACGGNPGCLDVVNCINACPAPRQNSCVNACARAGDVPPALTALAN
jgi:hypothetical protein